MIVDERNGRIDSVSSNFAVAATMFGSYLVAPWFAFSPRAKAPPETSSVSPTDVPFSENLNGQTSPIRRRERLGTPSGLRAATGLRCLAIRLELDLEIAVR
jgi:hypothetical protein